ncbi:MULTISPECIES: hypothetical protein [Streptomyces]|uniref:Aromatic ring-opening dioxygenase LigA n=1 Tax=Streptomyces virginiae TaxID=1961 RepID=A0ABQ3NDR4_STRVG|nr:MULTISPECIES: hypothetical protein [Streptomyces]MBP2346192.1 hypothetical protein [Streptomyces virginiae]MCI4083448.1 hypothetical protein [Streptomyces sp. MMS21 TC-5]GGQ35570.1 hypothetical protein GCM10010215_69310 [Streptomyces virginiae]GHI10878.1 hypothetical protein Scinn_03410 [Streptomyces virginiae]GLV95623.1 hypothetical protein Slala04_70760 [Streptomyces lavendulae subsp. lavendulae]
MPTAIAVTSADLVLPAPDRHTPGAALLHPPEQHDLEAALAGTSALLERHGHVVALVPPWLPRPTVQRLHTVRAILETDRIALLDIDLPPLGTALLARQLRQLSVCDFSPGVIASAARLLSHYIFAGALLGSVAKLDRVRVPVGLGAHARSWSPSAQFAVLAHPTPHLARLGSAGGGRGGRGGSHASHAGSHGAVADLPAGPDFATHLTFARGQLTSDWVAAELAPAWQVQGVLENPLPAASPAWWGTPKLVEFAAGIPDLSVLYQLVASVRREQCRWCGLELIGDRCGFCAAPLTAPPPSEAAATSTGRSRP